MSVWYCFDLKGVIMAKQTIYNAGIYVRLSQEDMRAGESLSIENQKLILTKYVKEQGWNLVDTYVDDGWSGTDFDRPAVQRLLSDAQSGKINLIICKDLSRFGRNYIEVGRYVDYIFPSYNIRFIALNDNVDTASKDTSALDMMPIVNLFNEWHAASTSKKIKAVIEANAKAGKYRTTCAPFGYTKGDDPNHLPVIDPDAAPIVRNIQDCGNKVRLAWNNTTNGSKKKPRKYLRHNYNCTSYMKFGKRYCPSHYIKMQDMDAIVLEDIRSLAQLVVEDEEKAKAEFLARKAKHHEEQYSVDTKKLTEGRYRLQELDTLIQNIYEDKVLGKVSEDVAMKLIAKYETEQKELSAEVADLEERFSTIRQDEEDVTMFMERLRKYTDVQELTREMCLELIEYITLDAYVEGQPREIYIYYKLLDEPLKDKRSLF